MKAKTFLLLPLSALLLGSCQFVVYSDDKVARAKLDDLGGRVCKDDCDGVKSLFSKNTAAEVKNLDEEIKSLCAFVEGDFSSSYGGAPLSTDEWDSGKKRTYFEISNNVKTSAAVYHFDVLWYIRDDFVPDDQGIWSLFVSVSKSEEVVYTKPDEWTKGITLS